MGYALAFSRCYACQNTFGFNPNRVPSVRDEQNIRQPVCEVCMNEVNTIRISAGLQPHAIHPEAYAPVDENELGDAND